MIQLINKVFFSFAFVTFILGCSSVSADEKIAKSYWLAKHASTLPAHLQEQLIVEPPDRSDVDLSVITIVGDKVIMNGNQCTSKILRRKPFSVDRAMNMQIDDFGGDEKFNAFLKRELGSYPGKWKETLILGASEPAPAGGDCVFIDNMFVFFSPDEVIIPYRSGFYRYVLGKPFSMALEPRPTK